MEKEKIDSEDLGKLSAGSDIPNKYPNIGTCKYVLAYGGPFLNQRKFNFKKKKKENDKEIAEDDISELSGGIGLTKYPNIDKSNKFMVAYGGPEFFDKKFNLGKDGISNEISEEELDNLSGGGLNLTSDIIEKKPCWGLKYGAPRYVAKYAAPVLKDEVLELNTEYEDK